jgi:hypothetical protein
MALLLALLLCLLSAPNVGSAIGTQMHLRLFLIPPVLYYCSIDPLAQTTPAWEGIERLKIVRAKIEDVRVKCDRAIVIMLHAHVTLAIALQSVEVRSRIYEVPSY